jgi:hypothetical protein
VTNPVAALGKKGIGEKGDHTARGKRTVKLVCVNDKTYVVDAVRAKPFDKLFSRRVFIRENDLRQQMIGKG